MLPLMQPVPLADVPQGTILRIVGAAGAGFPSPAQDWQDDAISLIELLRLDRAASFVFRISGSSMIDAGIHDNDVVVVDRDTRPVEGHIVIAIVDGGFVRSEEHTSELQSLMRISYAVFCLKKKKQLKHNEHIP